jgi:hypothetical protein
VPKEKLDCGGRLLERLEEFEERGRVWFVVPAVLGGMLLVRFWVEVEREMSSAEGE